MQLSIMRLLKLEQLTKTRVQEQKKFKMEMLTLQSELETERMAKTRVGEQLQQWTQLLGYIVASDKDLPGIKKTVMKASESLGIGEDEWIR